MIRLSPVLTLALLACTGPRAAAPPASDGPAASGGPSAVERAERTVAPVLGELHRLVTPDAIEVRERVTLGGIPQWIQIRGRDRKNPVLLFIHGGPGFAVMPASHMHQTPWEEYFTVVHWDQRGAGKTYRENDPAKVRPTMTVERMISDAVELVAHLRQRFGQEKVVVVGHSWGSVVGLEVARRHPEWLHAYVGAGQVVAFRESERRGYEATLAKARADHNAEAIAELEAIAPFPPPGPTPRPILEKERRWLVHYGGYTYRKQDDRYRDLVMLSPAYTDEDIQAFGEGIEFSLDALWPQVATLDFSGVTRLDCPIVLFNGRDDVTANAELAAGWFERLQAPAKRLVWFERSAHMMFEDEPGKIFVHLVNDVLPLTRR